MGTRRVVLLTPPKSSHLRPLLSHQHNAPISPLVATLMNLPASVANKELTELLNPLAATLTKNRGWGVLWLTNSHQSLTGKKCMCKSLVFCSLRTLPSSASRNFFACHSYENCRVCTNNSHFGTRWLPRAVRGLSPTSHESPVTFLPLLHYRLHFGGTACRAVRTPGNCFASTPLPRACANTCLPSKPASAPTPAKPAPTKKPGASPPCSTISITSAGPIRSTPSIKGILRKARRFCASRATPRRSSAPFFLTRTIAMYRANPRWSTRSSPATRSPASSPLARTSVHRKAFSILRWTP